MNKKVLLRLLAFFIDWLIILVYAGLLFGITILITTRFNISFSDITISPQMGHLIGFITLTLPVILYFTLTESGLKHGSLGKQILKLKVYDKELKNPKFINILVRNLAKFAPWELAHLGVHWAMFYIRQNTIIPVWVWITLITPQLIMALYLLIALINKKNRTIYELISKTRTY